MQWPKQLNSSLEEVDPEIADIIELEKCRQWKVFYCFFSLLCYFARFYLYWIMYAKVD